MKFNYLECVKNLDACKIYGFDDDIIMLVLNEARDRRDGVVIYNVAWEWYKDVKRDVGGYIALLSEAADLGDSGAINCLADEYRKGENVERDFQKAYELYLKVSNFELIDPEKSLQARLMNNVTFDSLVAEYGLEWYQYVLANHPTRLLRACFGKLLVERGDFDKGTKLLAQAANDGVTDACRLLEHYYSNGPYGNAELAKYWSRVAVENSIDV